MLVALAFALAAVLHGAAPAERMQDAPAARAACAGADDCRAKALEAAERKDYEAFHDLAWRAVQAGARNDPGLLYLLARAQSLSGRPHDALVMLRRIAATGAASAALTADDFALVRTLREWPEVERAIVSAAEGGAAEPPATERDEARPGAMDRAAASARSEPAAPDPAPEPPARRSDAVEALTFSAPAFRPSTLAYDAVSKRFIIGDSDVSRLAVVDEFSHQVATLASGRSAGFGTVTAIEIDRRTGTLWVASVDAASGRAKPALHKLQLISGRVLTAYEAPDAAAGRIVDLAVLHDGTVLAVLDAGGPLLRLRPDARSIDTTGPALPPGAASITVSDAGAAYVSHADGISRVAEAATLVEAPSDVDLTKLARIRWHRGAIAALQQTSGGYRVVRLRLRRSGRALSRVDVLDPLIRAPGAPAATVAGGVLYYLATADGDAVAIRRVELGR